MTVHARVAAAIAGTHLVVTGDGHDLWISDGTRTWQFHTAERTRSPYPGELDALSTLVAGPRLLVAEYVSQTTARHLADHDWSWVDDAGNCGIRAPGLHIDIRATNDAPEPVRKLSHGNDTIRLVRHLLGATVTGAELSPGPLALHAGMARPRVSQILEDLRRLGLVTSKRHGVWTVERSRLLDAFVASYPGPKGIVHHYHTIDAPMTVAARLLDADDGVVVSGDVAADLVAPTRRATTVEVYSPTMIAVPGPSVARGVDANVTVRIPRDPTVFTAGGWTAHNGMRLADPVQILWDLHAAGGDRLDAQEQYRRWLLERTSPVAGATPAAAPATG